MCQSTFHKNSVEFQLKQVTALFSQELIATTCEKCNISFKTFTAVQSNFLWNERKSVELKATAM